MIRSYAAVTPVSLLVFSLVGCSGTVGSIVDASPLGMARAAVQSTSAVTTLLEVRDTPSPLAGTYRVTTSLPEGGQMVFYARTTEKPVAPFLEEAEGVSGAAGKMKAVGYMLMAQAAPDLETLVFTIDELPEEGEAQTGGGTFYVATEPVAAEDGTLRYPGTMVLELARGQTPEADSYNEAFEELQRRTEEEDAQTEAFPSAFVVGADGSVVIKQTVMLDGEPYFVVHGERISEERIAN